MVDPARSALMQRIRGKNTKPELLVRRLIHSMGYRFRLHRRDLPGRPDLVFPSRRKVIFVHGCFWHRHLGCKKASTPTTRRDFWQTKFAQNVERDARKERELQQAGWDVFVVWECETGDLKRLSGRLSEFLGPPAVTGKQASAEPTTSFASE
ncbi:DNA mismatch endonuclease Vsr [Methylobacterium planeticum]|uniref:Very short patch repair endonuclease n=2 Tax=Methylobacterium planeticum TaxID=2615211 RepID=A0A6N6MHZ6_9HYPH|nr:very short patch repair endonuclease [Methylobacterium planeticum]KAB1069983.1 DNA mismatch endonuclease Vsr [Methylobacterium planeticum]